MLLALSTQAEPGYWDKAAGLEAAREGRLCALGELVLLRGDVPQDKAAAGTLAIGVRLRNTCRCRMAAYLRARRDGEVGPVASKIPRAQGCEGEQQ